MKLEKPHLVLVAFALILLLGFYTKYAPQGLSLVHSYPSTVLSSDAIFHAMEADYIAQQEKHGTMAPYLSVGHEDIYDLAPPLSYIGSAMLTKLSGIETYDTIFFLGILFVTISAAGFFLLMKELFNVWVGALSALMILFPLKSMFLYLTNIGWFHQMVGMAFYPFNVLLLYYASRKNDLKCWLLLSLLLSAQIVTHLIEGMLSLGFVLVYLLWRAVESKKIDLKSWGLIAFPVIFFISQAWILVNTWIGGPAGTTAGTKFASMFGNIPAGFNAAIPVIAWNTVSIFTLALGGIGLAYLFLGWKRENYRIFLLWSLVFLAGCLSNWTGVGFWFHRIRTTAFLLAYPLAALGVMALSTVARKKYRPLFFAGAAIVVLLISIPVVKPVMGMQATLISQEGYDALKWIQQNTNPDDRVFVFSGCPQGICAYMKRVGYDIRSDELHKLGDEELHEFWPGSTFGYHMSLPYRAGLFSFGHHEDIKGVNLCEMDYMMATMYQDIAPFINRYMEKIGGEIVYTNEKGGVVIVRNTKKEEGCLA